MAAWIILRAIRRRRAYAQTADEGVSGNTASPIMAERPTSGPISSEGGHTGGNTANDGGNDGARDALGAGDAGALGILSLDRPSTSPPDSSNNEAAAVVVGPHREGRGGKQRQDDATSHGLAEKPSTRSLGSAIAPKDAAIISDAFRNVLRKPDFPQQSSGNSTEQGSNLGPRESWASEFYGPGDSPAADSTIRDLIASRERENDEEGSAQGAHELLRNELATEGTSVQK